MSNHSSIDVFDETEGKDKRDQMNLTKKTYEYWASTLDWERTCWFLEWALWLGGSCWVLWWGFRIEFWPLGLDIFGSLDHRLEFLHETQHVFHELLHLVISFLIVVVSMLAPREFSLLLNHLWLLLLSQVYSTHKWRIMHFIELPLKKILV